MSISDGKAQEFRASSDVENQSRNEGLLHYKLNPDTDVTLRVECMTSSSLKVFLMAHPFVCQSQSQASAPFWIAAADSAQF